MSDSESDGESVFEIEVASPVNIALVKYWGKRDVSLILPFNDSISLTLDENHLGMISDTHLTTLTSFDLISPLSTSFDLVFKAFELDNYVREDINSKLRMSSEELERKLFFSYLAQIDEQTRGIQFNNYNDCMRIYGTICR